MTTSPLLVISSVKPAASRCSIAQGLNFWITLLKFNRRILRLFVSWVIRRKIVKRRLKEDFSEKMTSGYFCIWGGLFCEYFSSRGAEGSTVVRGNAQIKHVSKSLEFRKEQVPQDHSLKEITVGNAPHISQQREIEETWVLRNEHAWQPQLLGKGLFITPSTLLFSDPATWHDDFENWCGQGNKKNHLLIWATLMTCLQEEMYPRILHDIIQKKFNFPVQNITTPPWRTFCHRDRSWLEVQLQGLVEKRFRMWVPFETNLHMGTKLCLLLFLRIML